jgi:hypothetical protein
MFNGLLVVCAKITCSPLTRSLHSLHPRTFHLNSDYDCGAVGCNDQHSCLKLPICASQLSPSALASQTMFERMASRKVLLSDEEAGAVYCKS